MTDNNKKIVINSRMKLTLSHNEIIAVCRTPM